MPTDDLLQHATSSHDFYALLGVETSVNDTDLRRAYRRTALKYHPDKNADNPSAVETFHLLQIAYDVLSDAAVRAAYDNARAAREQRQRQHELLQGKRRQMKEDLEARERGVKRPRTSTFTGQDQEMDAEERLAREVQRLAEDGARRRREREEMLRRDRLEEEERLDQSGGGGGGRGETDTDGQAQGQGQQKTQDTKQGTGVSEIDRTVKVRWVRQGPGQALDKDHLARLFSRFGQVENTFLLKDKKQRVGGESSRDSRRDSGRRDSGGSISGGGGDLSGGSGGYGRKVIMGTGVIVFASIVGAHAAVEDALKLRASPVATGDSTAPAPSSSSPSTSTSASTSEWDVFEYVYWAANAPPDILASFDLHPQVQRSASPTAPSTPFSPASASIPGSASASASASVSGPTATSNPRPSPNTPSKPIGPSTPTPSRRPFPGLDTPNSPAVFSTPVKQTTSSDSTSGTAKGSSTGNGTGNANGTLKRVPSFASFTPKSSPFSRAGLGQNSNNTAGGSPSLEEITLIRLKNAEKRRLEEEIRRQEREQSQ